MEPKVYLNDSQDKKRSRSNRQNKEFHLVVLILQDNITPSSDATANLDLPSS